MALKQLRDSIKKQIKESKSSITGSRDSTMIDDGFGGTMPDPSAPGSTYTASVRISHEKITVQENQPNPVGLSTSFGKFVLTDYSCPVQENDVISDGTDSYRVGPVDQLVRYDGVFASQAPLEKVG